MDMYVCSLRNARNSRAGGKWWKWWQCDMGTCVGLMSRKIVKIAAQPCIAPSLYSYNGDMHAGHPINKWQVSVGKLKLPPWIWNLLKKRKTYWFLLIPITRKQPQIINLKFLFMSEHYLIGHKKQIRLKPQKCFARKARLKGKLNKGNCSMIMGWGDFSIFHLFGVSLVPVCNSLVIPLIDMIPLPLWQSSDGFPMSKQNAACSMGDEAPQQNGPNCLVRGSYWGVISSTEGTWRAQGASGVNVHAREVSRLPGVHRLTC